jgi:hypothetical protein
MTCEKCGKALAVGDYPFCPHESGKLSVIGDDVPGGFWVENGFDTPRQFYSKSAHIAALAAEGKEIRAKWAGPLDKIMTRWDAPSAKTLEDAKILLGRGREARVSAHEQMAKIKAEYPITVTEVKA